MKQEDLPKGATPLDPDEMDDLKIKTITTRGELDRWEQQNIGDAMDWLDSRKNKSEILRIACKFIFCNDSLISCPIIYNPFNPLSFNTKTE